MGFTQVMDSVRTDIMIGKCISPSVREDCFLQQEDTTAKQKMRIDENGNVALALLLLLRNLDLRQIFWK